ncbi:hypothetical protein [Schlesneria paludicola]|uniref:hypothetical protein n=1 Tax=Schlesneria paludicola TaxID=360056 RepID=UPI00029B30B2|nr:hypothetical protein [Schlesneria paludicola]
MFQTWLRAQRPLWLVIPLIVIGIALELHVARRKAASRPKAEVTDGQYDSRRNEGELLQIVRE